MTVENTRRDSPVIVEIRSPLAPEALMERIRAATGPESGWSRIPQRDRIRFRGTLFGSSVTVRLAVRSKWRYAFGPAYGPEFMGAVEADPQGSILRGRIRLDHMTRGMGWFVVIYMGCALAVIVPLSFIPEFRGPGGGDRSAAAVTGDLVLLAFYVVTLWALDSLPLWLWRGSLHEELRQIAEGGDLERA